MREKWGSTRGKKRRKSMMLRTFGMTVNHWYLASSPKAEGATPTSGQQAPQDQPLSTWTVRFPHPLCTWPSATKSAADAPSRTPRWKGVRAPFHPCHTNTMRLTYSLLFMVEIEYFIKETWKVQRQKKFTQSPELSWMSSMTKWLNQSSKAANLPTGHLQSHVPLNDNLW